MDLIWGKLTEWLKEMLVSGIMDNLNGVNPDLIGHAFILAPVQRWAQREDKVLDPWENLPGVLRFFKQGCGKRRRQIGKQIGIFHHSSAAASSSQ